MLLTVKKQKYSTLVLPLEERQVNVPSLPVNPVSMRQATSQSTHGVEGRHTADEILLIE